jgi:hypothetical protein
LNRESANEKGGIENPVLMFGLGGGVSGLSKGSHHHRLTPYFIGTHLFACPVENPVQLLFIYFSHVSFLFAETSS